MALNKERSRNLFSSRHRQGGDVEGIVFLDLENFDVVLNAESFPQPALFERDLANRA